MTDPTGGAAKASKGIPATKDQKVATTRPGLETEGCRGYWDPKEANQTLGSDSKGCLATMGQKAAIPKAESAIMDSLDCWDPKEELHSDHHWE